MIWTTAAPAVTTAFLSSLVEAVEALTIVLAVASVRGWRPAAFGALAGLALLLLIVVALGPILNRVPLHALQLVIGVLLLLFGMRWLRKAILRAGGVIALHDEGIAFATETEELRDQARQQETRLDWLAGLASFKAVVLEGLEVVFIVIAVGAGRGLVGPAIDANDQVIDRKAIPYPYPTHKDAVDTIESLATKFAEFGYETKGDFWWGLAADGKSKVRFIIEPV